MPIVPFESLPDASRVWVFAADRALDAGSAARLLADVDRFLTHWQAHGVPLHCAREWSGERFLAIGVDTSQEAASGCSIDGLYRVLQALEREVGTRLVAGGRVFYRDGAGRTQVATRDEFSALARHDAVTRETPVFDTSLTTAEGWRRRFEVPAGRAWTAALFT
jgi:hypothetical protein